MKLLDLHINGFGKFLSRDIAFQDGINIIYGENESGKSTLHAFIRCMLFGMERGRGRASKNDLYSRYSPWEQGAAYGGRMRIGQGDAVYRIERSFKKDQKSFLIVDEGRGCEVESADEVLEGLLCGLSETMYMNTVSIGQLKSATDSGMVSELRNYIANMNTSGNMSLDIAGAVKYLKERRRWFESRLHPDAEKDYAALEEEIGEAEREIAIPVDTRDPADGGAGLNPSCSIESQLAECRRLRSDAREETARLQKEREELLQRIAAAKQELASAQFTDEASVVSCQDEAEAIYQEHQEKRAACERKRHMPLFVILCMLAFAAAACAVFCFAAGGANLPFLQEPGAEYLSYAFAGAGALFALSAVLVAQANKRLGKGAEAAENMLREIFSRYLGSMEVSEEAKLAFDRRMEEYVRLSRTLEKSERLVRDKSAQILFMQEKERAYEEDISRKQKLQWEHEKRLERLAELNDRMETLKQVLEENGRIQEEIEAIRLALDTITELSSTIRSSFGTYLNQTASDIIREITGGAYSSLSVDENMDILMNTPEKLVPMPQLSSGTADQIYLAVRLAAAKLVLGDGQMPLVFDDSFALYDEGRLRAALRWLSQTHPGQILVFTCHKREAQALEAEGISYNLAKL